MKPLGHHVDAQGRSVFRVYAPQKRGIAVVLAERGERLALSPEPVGYWVGTMPRLPEGTRYWLEVDGTRYPDPASRHQPEGVHGPSAVVHLGPPPRPPGWAGVAMADAVIYELHVGTFTPEGTLAAAQARLPHLQALGVNVIELLPLAAFPGERNWGYDGTFLFALHAAYGRPAELQQFIAAAQARGMAVILDVVYNHFGPEGHYGGAFAPYTKNADTPWGAAINFDVAHHHGVRAFYLENLRYWLQDVGFDGVRMDAVSLIFDNSPVHILREFTDTARAIGRAEGREILTIAEHLRNNRYVTADPGFGYHAQWNDDLTHALVAYLTGDRTRHHANFGPFADIVRALTHGFVLDGTRFDAVHHYFLGTDGRLTAPQEHVVYLQNHDQVGNRPLGDRLAATAGLDTALLGLTTVFASPYVPMLFMGEEYGERAPFLFFEDFGDPSLVAAVRRGRKADFDFGDTKPPDPHARATFEASKLRWHEADTPQGRECLAYVRQLIAWKRCGELGPRDRAAIAIEADPQARLLSLRTAHTWTRLNFSDQPQAAEVPAGWEVALASKPRTADGRLAPRAAEVLRPA